MGPALERNRSRSRASLTAQPADVLMIEQDGHAAGADEHGDSFAGDKGVGEIQLEAVAANHFDGERPEGLALSESP